MTSSGTLSEETRDGEALPSYRGDLVNRSGFTTEDRTPDPELLIRGYERAALTLNFIRALSEGGFADLHHPEYWDLDFLHHSKLKDEYEGIVQSIREVRGAVTAIKETNRADDPKNKGPTWCLM